MPPRKRSKPDYNYRRGVPSLSAMQRFGRRYGTVERAPYALKAQMDQYDPATARGSEQSIARYGKSAQLADPMQRMNRKLYGWKGEGDYRNYLKWIPRGIGALAGGGLGLMHGGLGGAGSGAESGWNKGADFSKWAGWGDYGPQTMNSIMAGGETGLNSQQQIQVNSGSDLSGDVIMTHTEFIQNVTVTAAAAGTSTFQIQSFDINAGLSTCFPFLSQIANNFTLYEFEGLIFQYKPTSGEFGSTNSNSLGKVILATNYDPDASLFTSSQQMENYDYASASKPSCGMYHGIETKKTQRFSNQLYTRAGTSTKDKILTDYGKFQVATEGIYTGAAGTFVIGELWVTYKVKLSRKNLNDLSLGLTIPCDRFNETGVTLNTVPGANMVKSIYATMAGVVANNSATSFKYTFPVNISSGCFQVFAYLNNQAASGSIFDSTSLTPTNCYEVYPGIGTIAIGNAAPSSGVVTSVVSSYIGYLIINAPGSLQASFTLATTAAINNSASANLNFTITQVATSLFSNTP